MVRTGSPDHQLLILGLLRMQDMHGYQIAEMIESHFSASTRIKKPTLYDTLKKLRADGLVTSREEQEGNRPPRTVYTLTPEGEQKFLLLLKESISTYAEPDLRDEAALMFLEALSSGEVRLLLEDRRMSLSAVIEDQPQTDPHDGALRVISNRRAHHLRAELAWLDEILDELADENGEAR